MKWSKTVTQQPKPIESPNIMDIKAITIEYPEISYKLFKTTRQDKKVGSG